MKNKIKDEHIWKHLDVAQMSDKLRRNTWGDISELSSYMRGNNKFWTSAASRRVFSCDRWLKKGIYVVHLNVFGRSPNTPWITMIYAYF